MFRNTLRSGFRSQLVVSIAIAAIAAGSPEDLADRLVAAIANTAASIK